MSDDIVDRLRASVQWDSQQSELRREAADEIERLRAYFFGGLPIDYGDGTSIRRVREAQSGFIDGAGPMPITLAGNGVLYEEVEATDE